MIASPPRISLPVAIALAMLAGLIGPRTLQAVNDAPPEVVRLQVAEEMLEQWFPGRTGLVSMPADQFETLVEEARRVSALIEATRPIEPKRIEHRIRLEGGELVGQTLLQFPDPGSSVRWATLWPWSPAVEEVSPSSCTLIHRDGDGRAFLRIGPEEGPGSTRAVTISWRLRPRVEAEGRIFDLELIEGSATALILDLPEGITPSGPPGYREGPVPTGEPGRLRWRFDGPGGSVVLRLRSAPDPDRPSGPWIGGATLVELEGDAAGVARWTTAWSIDPGPEGHRPLVVSLPPGVTWEEVIGPEGAVSGVELRPGPEGTWLTVRWRDGLIGPTRLTLSGLAPIDDPSRWLVPVPEPLDAQWTGGPVIVWLDQSWSLLDCTERAGRRLDLDEISVESWQQLERAQIEVGRRPEQSDLPGLALQPERNGLPLAFFADRPAPVAELHLAPARTITSVSVQGTVRLRDGADTLEAEIDVEPPPEAPTLVSFLLSPGWLPDAIRISDGQLASRWEQEQLPDGRRMIRVALPGARSGEIALNDGRRPELIVSASLVQENIRFLELPRLRPVDLAIAEERWSIVSDLGVVLRPVEAEGLAWLDPAAVPSTTSLQSPRPLLSWRWVAPDALGRVVREPIPKRPLAIVNQRVTILDDRLTVEWELQLDAQGESLRTLPFRVRPVPLDVNGPSWSLVAAEGQQSRPLPVTPSVGDESELRLPSDLTGPLSIRGRLELPWDGEGPLPMLDLPRWFETRGTVSLRVDPALRCETRGDLSFRELGIGATSSEADRFSSPSIRLADRFLYEGQPGLLGVRTTRLPASRFEGVILRANLASTPSTDTLTRHRLALDVAAEEAATLGIELPEGAILAAVSSNGRRVEPFEQEGMIWIPLTQLPEVERMSSGRPRRLVVEFVQTVGSGAVEPDRPRFSMPCLSFSWNLAWPTARSLAGVGQALISADPGPDRPGWLPGVSLRRLPRLTALERTMLEQLDELAATQPVGGLRLGDALASWDVGRWPLVVDRSALEALGLGPSTIVPTPSPSGQEESAGSARRALSSLGLLAVPIDTVFLITSPAEAPRISPTSLASGPTRETWVRSLREAVAWGADQSDRFRTVERWRATAGGFSDEAILPLSGSKTESRILRRFVASGWPRHDAGVRSVDRWPWLMLGLGVGALLIVAASIRFQGRGWNAVRLCLLLLVVLGAVVVGERGEPRRSAFVIGPFYAGLIGLVIALIQSRPRPDRDESGASTLIRPRGSAARISLGASGVFLLIATVVGAQPASQADAPGGSPIIAFLIDRGTEVGDESEGPVVWLQETDAERLRAAASARPGDEARPDWPTVGVIRAEHELRPDAEEGWRLESRLTLRFEQEGPAMWSLPIGRPTELEAMVDGRPRPVLIGESADRATVALDGETGLHELVVRQRVHPDNDTSGVRLVLPINPVASASLRVADPPGASGLTLARSFGPITIGADGELRAAIGPSDGIEIRWDRIDQEGNKTEAPGLEGLLLWQALPTSDLLDARLTIRGASPVRELWFAIDPGVAVRSVRAAGAIVESSRIVADDGDRWIARIDPPLSEGAVLQLELRRALRSEASNAAGEPNTDPILRSPPRLEPIGLSRFDGQIALMRPKTWGGRLEAASGNLPMSDQEFEQNWGPFPRGGALDVAGATRFSGLPQVSVPLGPTHPRRLVEPTLQLDLDAGRWEWRLASRISDLDGRAVRKVTLNVPEDLELIDLEAPGLTSWDRPSSDQLRLRFDGLPSSVRPISLTGWLPERSRPMEPGPLVTERPLPWPEWPGLTVEPGTLLLSTPTTALVDYRGADGRSQPIERLATSNNRRRYRPIPLDQPGSLRVESFPAVTVELWSQLVLSSQSARWEALVRYRVSGGPADRIELILPESWAEGAEYELDGMPPVAVRDLGDRIEIDPGRPIWGSTDLRIRSVLPLEDDQPLVFPDLVAWGLGTATGHTIGLVVPSDRPPTLDVSGLALADAVTEQQFATLFPSPLPPDASRKVYRVQPGGWSLVVQPPSTSRGGSSDLEKTRVELVDLTCLIAPEGTVRGHAILELQPQPGPFLTLTAPPGAEAPAAVVDGRPVRPRIGPDGRWIIPLGDGPARRVELVWIDPMPRSESRRGRRLSIPQPLHEGATVLTTVRSAEEDAVSASGGATLPIPAAGLLVERLERAADRLRSRIDRLGSSSTGTDRDSLSAELARVLTLQRQAERSAYWAALMMPDTNEVVRQRGPLRRIVTTREGLDRSLLAAGLADLSETRSSSSDPGPPTDFLSPLRPGLPRHFRSETEAGRAISFDWTPGDTP
ncbi:hypothetical protein [Tautonia marina]|uniref:hypothetical protein n=1 Tax=Tautonia marina TaxID=2653855 RepID=UPI001260F06E|nr:hypothetical protein [Tautonia marina]